LHDPVFSRFGRTPTCHRQMQWTDRPMTSANTLGSGSDEICRYNITLPH